jgi:hypothetical protein
MDRDGKSFDGPEAGSLPATNGFRWYGGLETRPTPEKCLQRALALDTRELVAQTKMDPRAE